MKMRIPPSRFWVPRCPCSTVLWAPSCPGPAVFVLRWQSGFRWPLACFGCGGWEGLRVTESPGGARVQALPRPMPVDLRIPLLTRTLRPILGAESSRSPEVLGLWPFCVARPAFCDRRGVLAESCGPWPLATRAILCGQASSLLTSRSPRGVRSPAPRSPSFQSAWPVQGFREVSEGHPRLKL